MSQTPSDNTPVDIDRKKSTATTRRRTPLRRFYYALGVALLRFTVPLLWWSYRIEKIIGEENADTLRNSKTPYVPCFWHGQLVLSGLLAYRWRRRHGFVPCYVVSASVDGDVPTSLAESWGARTIRGSANSSGAHVLREMRQTLRAGHSIFMAADGPTGPNREFKAGVPLMARVANVPMMPMSFAADRAWHLRRWDNFMIPKPFARVVMAFGSPVWIPKSAKPRELEPWRAEMENAVKSLEEQSNAVFKDTTE